MPASQGKKKKPPTFHFLPKTRAKRLKKSWVQDHKIRSKWRAQKRREGLTSQKSDDASNDRQDDVDVQETSPNHPDGPLTPSPAPSRDKQSLRDLRKIAYTSKPLHTQKAHSLPRGEKGHDKGQPNMKLHMNLLLEKIKRDHKPSSRASFALTKFLHVDAHS